MSGPPRERPDRYWMAQALSLAALGEGTTHPNPRVGCVVVNDGVAVAAGYHPAAGQPHAEALAIAAAGDRARGATLYVNLEPCAHHGRTPPCADLIVRSGVARVVAAITDPDPRVNGEGFRRLREAGIRVDSGLLADSATWLNRGFIAWHSSRRPWVTLKAAASADGLLAAREGRSRWITGEMSRLFAHRMRFVHDAVLVGAGTVRRDDPRLTVRLPGVDARRRRVVVSAALDLDPGSRVFECGEDEPRTVVYTPDTAPADRIERLREVAEVRTLASSGRGVDPKAIVDNLGAEGVQSLMVEGGGKTLAAFLEAGAADEWAVFQAPRMLGADGGTPLLSGPVVEDPAHGWRFGQVRRVPLGEDLLLLAGVFSGES